MTGFPPGAAALDRRLSRSARMRAVSVAAASASVRAPKERGPAALLPVPVGAAGRASRRSRCLGVSQWQRMVAGLPAARALLWVLLAVLAAAAVVACERLPERVRAFAMIGAGAGRPARRLPRGGPRPRAAAAAPARRARLGARQRLAGAEHGPAPLRGRRPVAGAGAAAARLRAGDDLRAARAVAARERHARLPVPVAGRAARAHRLARGVDGRDAAAAARHDADRADRLLPVARAAAAAARASASPR